MRSALLTLALLTASAAHAQWQIEPSHTTAGLRGIAAVPAKDGTSPQIAWASGANGTILRTTDGGANWQPCAVPPDAAKLDFRGVQAFDENTAIVMSSGPGDQSRLYKTTDACCTWKLLLTNPDKDGFWDALSADRANIMILGDPVKKEFVIEESHDGGKSWAAEHTAATRPDEGAFAASNSDLMVNWPDSPAFFGAGSPQGARLFSLQAAAIHEFPFWTAQDMPMFPADKTAGIFSIAYRNNLVLVAVGGDYTKPEGSTGTAAFSIDAAQHWQAATALPHGYRSAVAYDSSTKTWITVGPNGTDISTDDGKNWRALKPSQTDAPDADRNWNALSLPFVVGPNGRIGKLNASALAKQH